MTELKQMFKAQVNSMPTTITNNISVSDTMIAVLDGSVLPDAPSLLVIGSGTNAETVKMTEKNIDIITVERGFQGSVKGWNVGTTVARNFTAYDHDAFMDNIGDLNLNKVNKEGSKVLSDLNYSQEDKDQIETNKLDIAGLQLDADGHKDEIMPHIMKDLKNNKTYRYGRQVSEEGVPQIISEEVI